MFQLARRFGTSAARSASFFARSSISPSANASIQAPTHFMPKSVILLSTPQNLPTAIEHAINFHQMAQLQVVVAGVDAVVPNGVRNGISELWLDEYLDISNSKHLDEKDHSKSDKTNWKNIDASLELQVAQQNIKLSLANTAFATSKLATLFYFQPKQLQEVTKDMNMGETLCELTVKLPQLEPQLSEPFCSDKWTFLGNPSETLAVTSCTGNLLKTINNLPAAKFLENNEKLMGLASKDTKVYVKLYQNGVVKKFEVIAGGGGWGAKADILAIDPSAHVHNGDTIEFYMLTPEKRYESMNAAVVSNQIRFECIPEETNYESPEISNQVVDHVFGCGCEAGFSVNTINYRSAGETHGYRW